MFRKVVWHHALGSCPLFLFVEKTILEIFRGDLGYPFGLFFSEFYVKFIMTYNILRKIILELEASFQ